MSPENALTSFDISDAEWLWFLACNASSNMAGFNGKEV